MSSPCLCLPDGTRALGLSLSSAPRSYPQRTSGEDRSRTQTRTTCSTVSGLLHAVTRGVRLHVASEATAGPKAPNLWPVEAGPFGQTMVVPESPDEGANADGSREATGRHFPWAGLPGTMEP
jgi:hypothetical protein